MNYDLIGDIHGQYDRLESLLEQLGYRYSGTSFRHPDRKAIFLGDLIDRGKQNKAVIDLVRRMTDNDQATVILGNHEFNAVAFHSRDPDTGKPLREHSEKNIGQHKTFLNEYPIGDPNTKSVIEWFKMMPLFLELDGFRVVHACWDQTAIDALKPSLSPQDGLTDDLILSASTEGHPSYRHVEHLLKGPEIKLPGGSQLTDKSGHARDTVRIKWWELDGPKTYRSLALIRTEILDQLPDHDASHIDPPVKYGVDQPVVFFGHYSLCPQTQKPLQASNLVCLDLSGHFDPPITAYRWEGKGYEAGQVLVV